MAELQTTTEAVLERLNQIRARQRTRPIEAVGDIEFLLGLIDSCVSVPIVAPVVDRIWHKRDEEMPTREEILVVHDRVVSIGYKNEFDLLNKASFVAWCTTKDLAAAAKRFAAVPASTVAPQQSEPTHDYAVTASTQCANCGGGIADYWTYCHRCGADREEAPASPAALRDEAELPRGYWPTLLDRGDGVSGHFCIGRLIRPGEMYWEFWNKGEWVSAGEVSVGREAAQKQLDAIRALATTPPSTLAEAAAEALKPYFTNDMGAAERASIQPATVSIIAAIIKRCLAGGGEDK